MQLATEDPPPLECGHESPSVLAPRHGPASGGVREPVAVGVVGRSPAQQAGSRSRRHGVPAELRNTNGVGEAPEATRNHAQTGHAGRFLRAFTQQLHAEADPERGPTLRHPRLQGPDEPGSLQGGHPRCEAADPRKHHEGGRADGIRVPAPLHVCTQATQGRRHAGRVGQSRLDEEYAHRTPFVLGTPPPRTATAVRSATATALKAASARWWSLSPFSTST